MITDPIVPVCPRCGTPIGHQSRFCPTCGASLASATANRATTDCGRCGSPNAGDSSYCRWCGAGLDPQAVPPRPQAYPPAPYGWPGQYPQRKSSMGVVLAIVAIAVVVVIVLAMFFVIATAPTQTGRSGTGDGEFSWRFEGRTYELQTNISYDVYKQYRDDGIQRYAYTVDEALQMCGSYVTPRSVIISDVATKLDDLSMGYSDLRRVSLVLSFVQNIEYVEDSVSVAEDEYWRYPVETLYDEVGDCEDKAFLFASLMEAMGYDAVILLYDGHAAAGVACEGATGTFYELDASEYFYCETTAVGWSVGDIPDEYGSAYIAQVG
ncbi:MAG: zinc ribbon domain-containing protein [Methanomassiliicoccus sp.]|nr:zinc ribbon domain-containing protein [Methanomassiliicoccus sp.]